LNALEWLSVCHFKAKTPAKRGFLKKNLKQPGTGIKLLGKERTTSTDRRKNVE